MAGVAMIEALIAMVLIALWMLANAGLQISTFKYQKSAANRFVAVALVGELSETIEANLTGAKAGNYALAQTSAPTSLTVDCTTTFCAPASLAAFDLANWTARVASSLPLKEMSVLQGADASGLVNYTIRVAWDEPRGRQTYAGAAGTTELLSHQMTKVVRDVGP